MMGDKIFKMGFITSVFILGTYVGSVYKERKIKKRTNYCGVLQVTDTNELYLSLDVEPSLLIDSKTVMFKVNRLK